jgi:1,4-alpha-glucan branching enzyme
MITKKYFRTRQTCQVTFQLPAEVKAKTAALCGEFNQWDTKSLPMKAKKDGSFSLTITLKPSQKYRFRYLVDGKRWENDWAADSYVPNSFGSDDSIVEV